jgi:hypothetical protein
MIGFIYKSRTDYGSSFSISIVCLISICLATVGALKLESTPDVPISPQYKLGGYCLSFILLILSTSSVANNFK